MAHVMRIKTLHPWSLSIARAREVQERLRDEVRLQPLALVRVRHVAGADIAISRRLDRLVAAVVVMSFPELEIVETRVATSKLTFPYVPGYLSFREIPALVQCLEKVRTPFDVMLCDGQGIAHPRRLGLASHLGLLIGTPTVGCAKSRLIGEHSEPGPNKGDYTRLTHHGDYIGSVLRTRERVKPIFVSPGHLVDHPSSRRIALVCTTRYRLPEPTRLADIAAGKEKRRLEQEE
jgi:deoxyribonuclease V